MQLQHLFVLNISLNLLGYLLRLYFLVLDVVKNTSVDVVVTIRVIKKAYSVRILFSFKSVWMYFGAFILIFYFNFNQSQSQDVSGILTGPVSKNLTRPVSA